MAGRRSRKMPLLTELVFVFGCRTTKMSRRWRSERSCNRNSGKAARLGEVALLSTGRGSVTRSSFAKQDAFGIGGDALMFG